MTAPVIFGTTRTHVDKTDNLFNVRLAAIYKPVQIGSFYASYGTSSNPSLSGLIYENATVTSLDPEKTRTFEAGTKMGFARQSPAGNRRDFPRRKNQCPHAAARRHIANSRRQTAR